MPHSLHQFSFESGANRLDHIRAGLPVLGIEADFDQFMMIQGQGDFIEYRRGQSLVADDNDGFAGMGEGLEVAFLNVIEHPGEPMAEDQQRSASVARQDGFTVSPSPLNGVKFELAVVLVLGLLLLLAHGRLTGSLLWQFLLLGGYGLLGMIWIIYRARQVLTARRRSDVHGPW